MKRPIGVTILAILALLAAAVALIHTLQMLHLFPVFMGPNNQITFFQFDLFGAILWGVLFLIYLWVFRMLWAVDPQGWLFVTVLSVLNLILAFVSILGATTFQEMLPSIIINGIVLIYALLPGTKAAFGVQQQS